jgi:hypothetical protein
MLTDYNNISVTVILNNSDTVNLLFNTAASSVIATAAAVKK